ncbi:hypothetical protein A2U01_0020706 [Trifolium medium]|uniref:Uncharacterized protein n=1 Tax=Trifolium medium TaxID=97028 RepID=A0A392NJU4_9FABA|nr:hypothetical protein [Trifolium medium]
MRRTQPNSTEVIDDIIMLINGLGPALGDIYNALMQRSQIPAFFIVGSSPMLRFRPPAQSNLSNGPPSEFFILYLSSVTNSGAVCGNQVSLIFI